MAETLTVYNSAPHPLGFSLGARNFCLALGPNTKIPVDALVAALRASKSALLQAANEGNLRLDKDLPAQVHRPRKVATDGGSDMEIDPETLRPPRPKLRVLHSTQAPCPKMMRFLDSHVFAKPAAKKRASKRTEPAIKKTSAKKKKAAAKA